MRVNFCPHRAHPSLSDLDSHLSLVTGPHDFTLVSTAEASRRTSPDFSITFSQFTFMYFNRFFSSLTPRTFRAFSPAVASASIAASCSLSITPVESTPSSRRRRKSSFELSLSYLFTRDDVFGDACPLRLGISADKFVKPSFPVAGVRCPRKDPLAVSVAGGVGWGAAADSFPSLLLPTTLPVFFSPDRLASAWRRRFSRLRCSSASISIIFRRMASMCRACASASACFRFAKSEFFEAEIAVRQTGHTADFLDHGTMQRLWKKCPQPSFTAGSPTF
mmetsp:Transcript_3257/g.6268  ORF Transcript_3257/g.6268 Transcript_3257/m.6268 type:complete len:277 (+) Transcript_3257:309-1139(+)